VSACEKQKKQKKTEKTEKTETNTRRLWSPRKPKPTMEVGTCVGITAVGLGARSIQDRDAEDARGEAVSERSERRRDDESWQGSYRQWCDDSHMTNFYEQSRNDLASMSTNTKDRDVVVGNARR
jgi:hypothetical protein